MSICWIFVSSQQVCYVDGFLSQFTVLHAEVDEFTVCYVVSNNMYKYGWTNLHQFSVLTVVCDSLCMGGFRYQFSILTVVCDSLCMGGFRYQFSTLTVVCDSLCMGEFRYQFNGPCSPHRSLVYQ